MTLSVQAERTDRGIEQWVGHAPAVVERDHLVEGREQAADARIDGLHHRGISRVRVEHARATAPALGQPLALRPEATAPICRAYLENGMSSLPQPVRLWCWTPLFRYDRPQAGRYRQFHQFNIEAIGDASAAIDAEVNRQALAIAYSNDFMLMFWVTLPIAALVFLMRRDRKSTRLNSSHMSESRMPSSA